MGNSYLTGRELAVYYQDKNKLKSVNLYGSGMIGKVKIIWDSAYVQDPDGQWFWNYASSDERSYYVKDHLGSIRLTFNDKNEILNAQDYHPYGELLRGYVAGESSRYLFTEKERDTETNYDYFGARFYDSELGRWLSVDPLADKYPGWSPYNYCLNNPLRYIDPNGMYSAETQDGSDPEDDDPRKKKEKEKQEKTKANTTVFVLAGNAGRILSRTPNPWTKGIGYAILAGISIYALLESSESDEEGVTSSENSDQNNACDGEGNGCKESDLTKLQMPPIVVPSTNKNNKGGTSVEERYIDKTGKPVTKHSLYDKNGKLIDSHFRPGGAKYEKK